MRILVCGGRDFGDISFSQYRDTKITPEVRIKREEEYNFIWDTLDNSVSSIDIIITGVARGADIVAYQWAVRNKVSTEAYPANWAGLGMAAGPIRNKEMLSEGKPDLVVAFPGGRGTDMMVQLAKKAGVEVLDYRVYSTTGT